VRADVAVNQPIFIYPARARAFRLDRALLGQVALCVVPAMTLVGFDAFIPGAALLFATLALIIAYHIGSGHPLRAVSVLIGLTPPVMLLRGLVLYSGPQILLAACLVAALTSPRERLRFMKNGPLVMFTGACGLYWLLSVLLTGDYSSNSRMLEFALTAANVFVLASRRSLLAASLLGIGMSAIAMAAGLLSHGPRLGLTSVSSEISVGNPIAMGLSASLGFLLTIADRGRWLLLRRKPVARILLNVLAGIPLVLSTSRGSWLVTLFGLALIALCNRSGRKTLLASMALFVVMIAVVLQTDRGSVVQHFYDNAVNDERSLDKRTTGRANQWESFPRVFDDSPLWGFGPGSGKAVSLRYTKEGKPWHSLYLLIGTETGLIGLSALAALLLALIWRGIHHLRAFGEVVPLLGVLSLMMIGVSVSGVDAISGVFLGLAFIGGDRSGMRRKASA